MGREGRCKQITLVCARSVSATLGLPPLTVHVPSFPHCSGSRLLHREPSDALLQHLPSYLGFSYLGRGVSLHSCSSKVKPLLLTLDEVEGCCKQITLVCARSLSHTGPAPTHGACALPAHTAQALGCSPGNRPRPALGCMHLPGLSRLGSGTQVVLRGADSVGPVICTLPRSEQLR